MKITNIQARNFLGARAVDVKLSKPIALFAGHNFAGKSSIQEAVRMALTGESVRISLKKDYGAIVSEGQESGFVELHGIDEGQDWTASMVLPSGKGQHSTDETLPFVLDAQRFARMSADDRRAFLFGLMGLNTDGPAVKERLTARGCDAKKIELVAPMLRAGFDAAQKEAQTKARECKAQWKTVTGGETYGSVKAASFRFEKQEVESVKIDEARSVLATIDESIEKDTVLLGDMQGRARQIAEKAGKLSELREKAGRFARVQDKLNKDEAELKEWQVKVEQTRQKASGEIRMQSDLTCPHCGGKVSMHNGELVEWNPPAKTPDADAVANLPEYERSLKLFENSVANDKRDLAAAETAAAALKEIESATAGDAPDDEEIAALKARIDTLKQGRTNQLASIRALEDAARRATEADEKTARATALHLDVQKWEAIGDALAPDGIPGEMLAEALGPINDRLFASARDTEWQQVVIHSDMRITYGLRDYALISESEKWRADAMIAEAISFLSGVKLLVLDRFDVLDIKGREDLLLWLDMITEDGEVETALIFGTLKSLPGQIPNTVGGFWIENGTVSDLKVAA